MFTHQRVQLPLDRAAAHAVAHADIVDVGDDAAGAHVAGEVVGQQAETLQQRDGGVYFQ